MASLDSTSVYVHVRNTVSFRLLETLCSRCNKCNQYQPKTTISLILSAMFIPFCRRPPLPPQSDPLSIPSLPLHVSVQHSGVCGTAVDTTLACCQAHAAGLCVSAVLERTRVADAGPLHQPHQH